MNIVLNIKIQIFFTKLFLSIFTKIEKNCKIQGFVIFKQIMILFLSLSLISYEIMRFKH